MTSTHDDGPSSDHNHVDQAVEGPEVVSVAGIDWWISRERCRRDKQVHRSTPARLLLRGHGDGEYASMGPGCIDIYVFATTNVAKPIQGSLRVRHTECSLYHTFVLTSYRIDARMYAMSAPANNLASLAVLIRDRRKALRLTQQDLADLCGVQRQTIGRLEAADPTVAVGTAMAVTDALGLAVSPDGTVS